LLLQLLLDDRTDFIWLKSHFLLLLLVARDLVNFQFTELFVHVVQLRTDTSVDNAISCK